MKEKIKIKGEITARLYDQSNLSFLSRLWNKFVLRLGLDKKRWYILGRLKMVDVQTNVICKPGLEAIGTRLTGDNTYTGEVNKMALGTGTPTPSVNDTTLETESYRNDTASGTASDNVTYLTAYYTETEVTGTFTEFGNFIDGTDSADTGQLWSHIAGFSWEKDDTTTLVVDCKYTFTTA